jgi:hypothetical protein
MQQHADSIVMQEGACKERVLVLVPEDGGWVGVEAGQRLPILSMYKSASLPVKKPDIAVHGNIKYQFSYFNFIDTPYAQENMMQHIVQTQLQTTWQEKYPFDVWITSRRANSPFFLNTTDVSIRFRQEAMLEKIRHGLLNEIAEVNMPALYVHPQQLYQSVGSLLNTVSDSVHRTSGTYVTKLKQEMQVGMDSLYAKYKGQRDSLALLQSWVQHPNRIQEAIVAKERSLRAKSLKTYDSTALLQKKDVVMDDFKPDAVKDSNAITAYEKYVHTLTDKKAKVEQLQKRAVATEHELMRYQQKWRDSLAAIRKRIAGIRDKRALYDYYRSQSLDAEDVSGVQKILLAVKQVGIGRSWLDYTDLTVKNISLNGFQIEMTPGKWYVAGALGSINYRFRDFVLNNNNTTTQNQRLAVVRTGIQSRNGTSCIVTLFNGNKAMWNTPGGVSGVQQIAGMSVAGTAKVNDHYQFQIEYARSTQLGIAGSQKQQVWKDVFDVGAKGATAWTVKGQVTYPLLYLKAEGYYRHIGPSFQSFTLYTTGSSQTSWMLKLRQQFWRQKLTVDASVRQNDFSNSQALQQFSNKTIFASLQASLRIPKYPFLSVGYYPTSQFTLGDNQILYESQYKTINAACGYVYYARHTCMSSSVVYSKFYNSGADTSFIYYNAATFTATQHMNYKNWTWQASMYVTEQAALSQWTIEPMVGYKYRNAIQVNGSVKYSRTSDTRVMIGSMLALILTLNKVGTLQAQYDKSYVPCYNKQWRDLQTGRVVFLRTF